MKKLLITTIVASAFATAATANDMTDDTTSNSFSTKTNTTAEKSAGPISKLPATGSVNLSGTVKDIDVVDNEFTLTDETGATIDVETEDKLTVKKGDKVSVNGKINEDMGEKEISAANITVTASASSSTDDDDNATY